MTVTDYCCVSRQIEPVEYYCIWDIIIDFLHIFAVVKLISWIFDQPCCRFVSLKKSPPLKPRILYHDMFLRKRLMAINWKLMANKARAMYYMKLACSRKRWVTNTNSSVGLKLQRTSEDSICNQINQEIRRCRS